MKKTNLALYEPPHAKEIFLSMNNAILNASTSEVFEVQDTDYADSGWNWNI